MTATSDEKRGLRSQFGRFVAVGAVSALVDFGIYFLLLWFGSVVPVAKGVSFIVGTTTAYLLNRRFTFDHSAGGRSRFVGFLLLYGTTFFLNIGVNALAIELLPDTVLRLPIAWVIAQAAATAVNFVLLRTVVFRH